VVTFSGIVEVDVVRTVVMFGSTVEVVVGVMVVIVVMVVGIVMVVVV